MKDKNGLNLEAGDTVYCFPDKDNDATCEFVGDVTKIKDGNLATVRDGDENFYDFESHELEIVEE